jgi:hypothetical protein
MHYNTNMQEQNENSHQPADGTLGKQLARELLDIQPQDPQDLEPQVQLNGRAVEISFPHLALEPGADSVNVSITLQKEVTPMNEEAPVENELPAVQEMIEAARALRDLPEAERPRKVMEILRGQIDYPYRTVVEDLKQTDPERAAQLEKVSAEFQLVQLSTLREATRLGYGNCMPLTTGMLVLGREAGLEGAYLTNAPGRDKAKDPNPIKNVIRMDNQQPLFKGDQNYGENIPVGHAWAEFKLSDGRWMPVDPSTQLVGDTDEGMEVFRQANYRAGVGNTMTVMPLPTGLKHSGTRDLEFYPGESQHQGTIQVEATDNRYEGALNMSIKSPKLPAGFPLGVSYEISSAEVHG